MRDLIKIFDASINESSINIASELLKSGEIASGAFISKFEKKLEEILNYENILAVSDMTSAIEIIFNLIGLDSNSEILATPFSCLSSNSPIAYMGINVKWMDFKENSLIISIDEIKKLVTKKTKAIMIYYVAGYVYDIKSISDYCRENNIYLIEDCNNSLFSKIESKFVGGYGDFTVFSFYPNRVVNTIDGGAIKIKNIDHYRAAKKLRRYGIDMANFRDSDGEINISCDIEIASRNYCMSNVSAAIAYNQISHHESRCAAIMENCDYYKANIKERDEIKFFDIEKNVEQYNWVFFIKSNKQSEILKYLKENHVSCTKLHYLNNRYSCFRSEEGNTTPNAEVIQKEVVALPCGWWLTENDRYYITNLVNSFN